MTDRQTTLAGEAAYEERDTAKELGQTVRERMRSRGNERWWRDSLILAHPGSALTL